MTDLVPPGNMPLPSPDEAGAAESAYWQGVLWPALWPKLVLSYPTSLARDAELPGLGPSERAFCFVEDTKTFWRWSGTAWALAAPWVQSGTASLAGDATNPRSAAVTFPKPFTSPPVVMTQLTTGASSSSIVTGVSVSSITTTGCTIYVVRNSTTTVGVSWQAIQNP